MTSISSIIPRKLQVFAAVFDSLSTTLASNNLGLSQSAVSKSIAQLEADLGQTLFERTPQGFRPTIAAQALRRRVRWILRELDLAENEMRNAADLIDAELVIAAGPVWNLRYLPVALPRFHLEFPRIRLDIVTGSGDYFVSRILDGSIDVYFGKLAEELQQPNFACFDLLAMRLQAFARSDHSIFDNGQHLRKSLSCHPWMGFSHDTSLDGAISTWCQNKGLDYPGLSMKTMSLASMISLAKSTNHIVFAVDTLETELVANGLRAIPGTEDISVITTGVAMRSSLAQTRAMLRLMRIVQDTLKEGR